MVPFTGYVTLDLLILLNTYSWYSIFMRQKLKDFNKQKQIKEEIKKDREYIETLQKQKRFLEVPPVQSRVTELSIELLKTNYSFKMFLGINLVGILLFVFIGSQYNKFGAFFSFFGLFSFGWIWFHLIFALILGYVNRKIYKFVKAKVYK